MGLGALLSYVEESSGETVRHTLARGCEVIVGRESPATLILPDRRVSSKHCRIAAEGDRFFVQHLGTTNHTHLRSGGEPRERPLQRGDRAWLSSGDLLRIGPIVLRFELAADAGPTATPHQSRPAPPPSPAAKPNGAPPDLVDELEELGRDLAAAESRNLLLEKECAQYLLDLGERDKRISTLERDIKSQQQLIAQLRRAFTDVGAAAQRPAALASPEPAGELARQRAQVIDLQQELERRRCKATEEETRLRNVIDAQGKLLQERSEAVQWLTLELQTCRELRAKDVDEARKEACRAREEAAEAQRQLLLLKNDLGHSENERLQQQQRIEQLTRDNRHLSDGNTWSRATAELVSIHNLLHILSDKTTHGTRLLARLEEHLADAVMTGDLAHRLADEFTAIVAQTEDLVRRVGAMLQRVRASAIGSPET